MKRQLGPYELMERIGVGGMAEVFLAQAHRQGNLIQPCVVKVLHSELSDNHNFIRMLLEEAGLIARLRHNNIASLYDVGREDGTVFLVMEYVDGQDLHALLAKSVRARRELPIPFAIHVARGLCAGLHFAHTRRSTDGKPLNLIHRDISPPNVLVSTLGEIKLIDFGVAKFNSELREKTRAGVIKGKFGYMSPEQAWDEELDQRSDLFSVGVCLYEMLTGRSLYGQSDDALTMLKRAREADIDPVAQWRPDVPDDLADIVHGALRTKRADRFQTAHEMERLLTAVQAREAPDYTGLDAGALMAELFDIDEPALHSMNPRQQQSSSAPAPIEEPRVDEDTEPMADVPGDVRKSGAFKRDAHGELVDVVDVSNEATVNLIIPESDRSQDNLREADFSQEKTELFDEDRISGAYPTIDRQSREAPASQRRRSSAKKKDRHPKGRAPSRQTRQIKDELDEQDTDPRHDAPKRKPLGEKDRDPRQDRPRARKNKQVSAKTARADRRHRPTPKNTPGDDNAAAQTVDIRQRLTSDDLYSDDSHQKEYKSDPDLIEPEAEPRKSPTGTAPNPILDAKDIDAQEIAQKKKPRRSLEKAEATGPQESASGGIDRRIQIGAAAIFVIIACLFVAARFL